MSPRHSATPQITPQYNLAKADWESFRASTATIADLQKDASPQDNYRYFLSHLTSIANATIPKTKASCHKRQVPWWSTDLSAMVKLKHSLERKMSALKNRIASLQRTLINSSLLQHYSLYLILVLRLARLKPFYNRICAQIKKTIRQRKLESWRSYISSLNARTPLTVVWKKFHRISGNHRYNPVHALQDPVTGDIVYDKNSIARVHAEHIAQVSSEDFVSPSFRSLKLVAEQSTLNFNGGDTFSYNLPFTEQELFDALRHCPDSAPGPDSIPYAFVRHFDPNMFRYLLELYNQLWSQGVFPVEWRHAHEIPIPKPNKDPSLPTNSRPISLTMCLCKLMEKMVNPRLLWFAENNGLLSPSQSGSRPGRSTLHSLVCLEEQIKRGFANRQPTVAVFFDISKAYDTTWRHHILRTLHSAGLRGPLAHFLVGFLHHRTFQVRLNGALSDTYELQMGIPQGSVLSSTLFAIAVNGVTSWLPSGVS